jgi:hypothetical protein
MQEVPATVVSYILASASSAFEERFCTETAAGCALSGALKRSLWLCIKYQGR